MVVKIRPLRSIVCIFIGVFLLAGCSGHPGAGKWVADKGGQFAALKIDFDGKATIHPTDAQQPVNNCYWQASSANNLDLQCGTSDQEEGVIRYHLAVSELGVAILTQGEQVLGQFKQLP